MALGFQSVKSSRQDIYQNIAHLSVQPKSLAKQKYTTTYVIKKGYFNLVRCLLSVGADPNHVSEKEPHQRTSLIYSTFIKDEKWAITVAQNLLEHGASLSQTDSNSLTPIHYCCAFGRDSLLEILLGSLDFDLSKSFDQNGNTCMHYAIRSHNLKCVKLLIKKFKLCHWSHRVDLRNKLGLRPTDLEDDNFDLKFDTRKDLLFNGSDSLDECKNALKHFIKISSQVKIEIKIETGISDEDAIKVKDKRRKKGKNSKKSSLSIKSKKKSKEEPITEQIIIPDEKVDEFFQTQLDESEFKQNETQSTKGSKNVTQKKSSSSNFNHSMLKPPITPSSQIITEPKAETENYDIKLVKQEISQIPRIGLSRPSSGPNLINRTELTNKSFLLILKELLQNYISYDDLFYAKEHMIQAAFEQKKDKKTNLNQFSIEFETNKNATKQPSKFNDRNKILESRQSKSNLIDLLNENDSDRLTKMIASKPSNELFVYKDWKQELPNLFNELENFMTPSFRETIQPQVSTKLKYSNRQYLEMKQQLKRAAFLRRKKTNNNTTIIRHSLLSSSSVNQFLSGNNHLEDENASVFEEDVNILPLNSNSAIFNENISFKRRESLFINN